MPNNKTIADHFTKLAKRAQTAKLRAHYLSYAEKFRPTKLIDLDHQRDPEKMLQQRLRPFMDDVDN